MSRTLVLEHARDLNQFIYIKKSRHIEQNRSNNSVFYENFVKIDDKIINDQEREFLSLLKRRILLTCQNNKNFFEFDFFGIYF